MVVVRMPLFRRPLLTRPATYICEALLANASRMPTKKGRELLPWKVEDGARQRRLTRSYDPQKTLPQAVQVDPLRGVFGINFNFCIL